MSTTFLSQEIWPKLTKAVRGCRRPCAVAVAYLGAGASRLLPLPKGSRLVVDASERAVTSGQTCPADLLKLVKKGVMIYSVPNLHAKVFVCGSAAYIGSANASRNSAEQLVEALVRTNEAGTVRAARQFVLDHCLHQMTPKFLEQLAQSYRPPRNSSFNRKKKPAVETSKRPTLPRLLLAQLELVEWSDRDQEIHDKGMAVARKRREHPRSFELDSFSYRRKCFFQQGDVVIQITNEGGRKILVSPPGNVLYVRNHLEATGRITFVYLERPCRRRRHVNLLAKTLGYGALKRLKREGVVKNAAFGQSLLKAWNLNKK